MTGLRLGPLLRYVDWDGDGTATVWIEADRPCTAEVRCDDGAFGKSRTFQIAGHHYALILVAGLTPGTSTSYEVLLDARRVWPPQDSPFPPSTIRTPAAPSAGVRVSFGSCRWASPRGGQDPVGPDALDTLAAHLIASATGTTASSPSQNLAAFPDSFEGLAALISEVGTGPDAPATVCVLSGDVHHAYIAKPSWTDGDPDAHIVQLTCSPVHNSIPSYMKWGFRFGWSELGRSLGRVLKRHGRVKPASVTWLKMGGPWFGNQLMTLTLRDRCADLRLDQTRTRAGRARLVTVQKTRLTPGP